MKTQIVIIALILLASFNVPAQVKYDTVSNEVLKNYILDAEPERDTVSYYCLWAATVRPEFPGGRNALIRYVNENIDYPQTLADTTRQQEIFCRVIIDDKGKITPQSISQNGNKILIDQVRTLLETFPLFRPGEIRGEKKDFQVFLTFYFTKDTTASYPNNPYFIPVFPTGNPAYRGLSD